MASAQGATEALLTSPHALVLDARCPHGCEFRTLVRSFAGWMLPSQASEPVLLPKLPPVSAGALRLQLRLKAGSGLKATQWQHRLSAELAAAELQIVVREVSSAGQTLVFDVEWGPRWPAPQLLANKVAQMLLSADIDAAYDAGALLADVDVSAPLLSLAGDGASDVSLVEGGEAVRATLRPVLALSNDITSEPPVETLGGAAVGGAAGGAAPGGGGDGLTAVGSMPLSHAALPDGASTAAEEGSYRPGYYVQGSSVLLLLAIMCACWCRRRCGEGAGGSLKKIAFELHHQGASNAPRLQPISRCLDVSTVRTAVGLRRALLGLARDLPGVEPQASVTYRVHTSGTDRVLIGYSSGLVGYSSVTSQLRAGYEPVTSRLRAGYEPVTN